MHNLWAVISEESGDIVRVFVSTDRIEADDLANKLIQKDEVVSVYVLPVEQIPE